MSYEITATLHKKFDTENKTENFQARDIVLKTEGQYPQFVKLQLTQDKCDLIDSYKEGEMIKVYFDLRGREWNEKYFTNLNAWKIEAIQTQQAAIQTQQAAIQTQQVAPQSPPPVQASPFSEPKMVQDAPLNSYEGQAPKKEKTDDFDDLPF